MGRPSSGCGDGSTGAATQAVPRLGHPSDCLTPAARGSHRSRVLPPLLPSKTPLYVYGSLTVGSPHVMEPDCSADPGIWIDLHLLRSTDLNTPMGGMPGYVAPPPGLTPPDFSIWSIPPPEVPPPPGLPASPLHQPPVGRASLLRAAMNQQAQMLRTPGSQAQVLRATVPQVPTQSAPKLQAPPPQAPQMVPPLCQPLPSSGSQAATPYQQAVQLPVKPKGRGVTFDTSADKVAAVCGQDTDGCGRQRTHKRDNKTWPTSPGRGVHERSSVRMTGKQTLRQVSEHPSGAARDAPRDSTPGSTLHQCNSSTRAPKDPLRCVAQFWSQGWKKDLEHIFWAYYEYNFTSLKEAGWNKIRDKVFEKSIQVQVWGPLHFGGFAWDLFQSGGGGFDFTLS